MSERIYEETRSGKIIPKEKIVRCINCKHYMKDFVCPVHPLLGGGTVTENACDYSTRVLKDTDFCSHGEEKESIDETF